MPRKLILVDGSNHAFRVFHAMPRLTAAGRHTGALLGFANLLRSLQRDEQPDYVAVVFDKGKSFRNDLFPDYKGHRPDMPDELREQWPAFEPLVEGWGFRFLAIPGFEADDVIGTLARAHASEDLQVVIISGDKDFTQLVGPHVQILDLKANQREVIREAEVKARFGVGPDKVVDILSLWGDASDNVPGVPGIGEKKGSELIQAWGDLDQVLAHAGEIKGKMGENLRTYGDQARLSRQLVTIRTDMDLPFTLDDLAVRPRDTAALRAFLLTYQLRTHLKELEEEAQAVRAQGGEAEAPTSGIDRDRYRTVTSLPALREAVAACRAAGRFAFDTETTSLDPLQARLVGVSLCWSADDAVYVPVGHVVVPQTPAPAPVGQVSLFEPAPAVSPGEPVRAPDQLPLDVVLAELGPLLSDPAVGKLGQHLKYDLEVMRGQGVALEGIVSDTLLADYLLEPNREAHGLDDQALRYLGHRMIAFQEVTAGIPNADFSRVPIPQATRYSAEDAHVTWLLDRDLLPRLRSEGLYDVFQDIELPVIPVLAEMELVGIRIDPEALAAFGKELDVQIARQEADIHEMAGHPFNIGSPKQLAEVLFDERGLQSQKKTKTGRSTDAQTLEQLAAFDPLPAAVLAWRSITKLKNTYVDALPKAIHPLDGRVHTSFHQAVAATGRLSSQDPNLQNIPIRTPEGRRIRSCFVAEPGHVLLSADYSQIELRILADYCGEGPLLDAFLTDQDIHRATAALVFGVHPSLVTTDQRRAAKAVNFGIIYGMSAFRLSNELGIGRRQAQKIIDDYFEHYPQIRAYTETAVARARERGHATTRYGRKRVIADLNAHLRHIREGAERIAINTPIQGTAADIMKLAMVRVWRRLQAESSPARLLLQVHDELLLEVPEAFVEPTRALVVEEMGAAATLKVPLSVGTGVGRNWEEAH